MSGECILLGSVSSQQKFEATDIKALGASQLLDNPCYSSQTDQFYLEKKGKYILMVWGHLTQKMWREDRERQRLQARGGRERERETPGPLALLFICFILPLGLPCVNWASQECCLFYLRSSLSPQTFLCSIFVGFSLPCLLATTILDSCFLF